MTVLAVVAACVVVRVVLYGVQHVGDVVVVSKVRQLVVAPVPIVVAHLHPLRAGADECLHYEDVREGANFLAVQVKSQLHVPRIRVGLQCPSVLGDVPVAAPYLTGEGSDVSEV